MSDSNDDDSRTFGIGPRREKVCGICGKVETNHWRQHWRRNHSGMNPFEHGTYPVAVPTPTPFGD